MSSSPSPKRAVFAEFAAVAQALANPHRMELIELLAQGERSVEVLAGLAGLRLTNASQHLQLLRRAGLVTARRAGKQVRYALAGPDVIDLLMALCRTAERGMAEIDRIVRSYFRARDGLEPISHEELAARLRDGLVTLIDVRPAEEFAAGHIQGAVNVPLPEMPARLASLPAGRAVVAYCRGPYCVYAFEAVAALRAAGFDARRLVDGYPEWWAAGWPVASAA
jgi:rhodanese-related sulfurtransferase/DNA-binding transcriptional ArsR family regulator